jgi:hypothetical protein
VKNGSRVLAYYLALTYGAQTILAVTFSTYFDQDYRGYSSGLFWRIAFMAVVAAVIFYGQAILTGRLEKKRARIRQSSSLIGEIAYHIRLPLAFTFLALAVPFGIQYGFSFWHSGLYISDLPFWVVALQGMKSIARLDLAYCTIKVLRGEKLSNVDIIATAFYTLGGIVALAGAVDIVFLALGALLLYRRGELVIGAFAALGGASKRTVRVIVYPLLIVSLPAAAFIGFANKIGVERTFDIVQDKSIFLDGFAIPLALRISSSHGSFVANAELPLSLNEQVESISYPLHNLTWRACILFVQSGCSARNDITHIARLNYVRTFWDQSPLKAGATPGLLASALYIPFLPLSLALLAFYCSLFTGAIDRALGNRRLSFAGILILVLFAYPAFENPVDLLVIFDPAFAYTVGLYFILRSFRASPVGSGVDAGQKMRQAGGTSSAVPSNGRNPVRPHAGF